MLELRILKEHVVMCYPQLNRCVVFFREGGTQVFDLSLDSLPSSLQSYVNRCKQEGKYEILQSQLRPGKLQDGARSQEFLECQVYCDSYPKNMSRQM